ncbi:MAG: hypothetical protein KAY48_06625 [Saprospiraceae bacterium]|nr:hypothetical protein [Saprospiraceae bacterium]
MSRLLSLTVLSFDGNKTTNQVRQFIMTVAEPAKSADEREKRLSSRPGMHFGVANQQIFNVLNSSCFDLPACGDISPFQHPRWQNKRLSR